LDRFRNKFTREWATKWRMAEIMEVRRNDVLVHFVNWSHTFDEWIDMSVEAYRVA
jgi:hypothetical protein